MKRVFHTSKVSVFMATQLVAIGYEPRYFEEYGEPYVEFEYKGV